MLYQSTRGGAARITAAEAIAKGLSEDGGLFVPESFPGLTPDAVKNLTSMPYAGKAAYILGLFLEEFSTDELRDYSAQAYGGAAFDHPEVAPLRKLNNNTYSLELWHGPTSAFKDMALQILPRLLPASLKKINEKREVCVLAATSGDTGKAALEGFRDIPGTKIMVFYPKDGVSEVQKLQMTSQSGGNVNVVAVDGNFDDTQSGVKAIFSDGDLRGELGNNGCFLSSANSINWGRLAPQIAYYVSAYCDLLSSGGIKPGEEVNFCVPTGNFGNILAAYYAALLGLPVNKLICASNRNDVLTQFINTGVYDKNRAFYTTVSPSMDILVSSNLERLLFEVSGKDGGVVSGYMKALSSSGVYEISQSVRAEINRIFAGGVCAEDETLKTIAGVYDRFGYLIDTHTAVAFKVMEDYRAASNDARPCVVVSTASPFKFCDSVIDALGRPRMGLSGVGLIGLLADVTGCDVPAPLSELSGKTPRFTGSVRPDGMKQAVREFMLKG